MLTLKRLTPFLAILLCLIFGFDGKFLPTILWDSRNFLFGCQNLTIYVHYGDTLMLACPSIYLYSRTQGKIEEQNTFETIYGVPEGDVNMFNSCNSTGLTPLHTCTKDAVYFKFDFTLTNDIENGGFPQVGAMTYYLFSTSERTKAKQDNRINGSCIPQPPDFHSLKLKIYKCAQNDPDPRCKVECKNMDCYLEGCGKWNNWETKDTFFWNGTSCLQKSTRDCSTAFPCKGDTERLDVTGDGNCTLNVCPSPSIPAPTPSTTSSPAELLITSSILDTAGIVMSCSECRCSNTQSLISSSSSQGEIVVSTVTIASVTVTSSVAAITETVVASVTATSPSVATTIVAVTPSIATVTTTVVVATTVVQPAVATVVTVTKTESVNGLCSTPGIGEPTVRYEYVKQDIVYDDKFYITVISAIIGAILVGVFVTHACRSYKKGNKIKTKKQHKVIEVKEYSRVTQSEQHSSGTQEKYTKVEPELVA